MSSTEPELRKEHQAKIDISKTGLTTAVLLNTLLRRYSQAVPHSTAADCCASEGGSRGHDHAYGGDLRVAVAGGGARDVGVGVGVDVEDPETYLEKHFPWVLTLIDRRLFRALLECLVDEEEVQKLG